jgi:hypothetical protein
LTIALTPPLSLGFDGEFASTNISLGALLTNDPIPSSAILSFGS